MSELSNPARKDTYLIIPVYNRRAITLACLERLHEMKILERYSVIVVDDASTDGTVEAIQSRFSDVVLIHGTGSLWWTGAITLGMKFAYQQGAQYIIWLNDDCQFDGDILDPMIQHCNASHAIVGAQGYRFGFANDVVFGGKIKTWKGFKLMKNLRNEIQPCDLLSGNLVCIPRQVIDVIGYPNPDIAPHYGGDSLYLIAAQKAGFSLWVDARHHVWNIVNDPAKLYPTQWLLAEGTPWSLFQLIFVPQSGLSWRIWWAIDCQSYGCWGVIMFLKKYLSLFAFTGLRFLPFSLRKRLSLVVSGLHS